MSSTYHPQTNEQTKVVNKCLEAYLRYYATEKQNKWVQWLHLAEWWYNYAHHMSAKLTPLQDLYGYEPPKWKYLATVQTNLLAFKNQLEETQNIV